MDAFADIEGPVRIGFLFWILLAVGSSAGTLLLVLLINKLRSRPKLLPEKIELGPSPIELALQRLNRLRDKIHQLEAEAFIVEVSDIVRNYIQDTLRIPAKGQTSEEFLQGLEFRKDLPHSIPDNMPAFLEACDMVKFARQSLQQGQREQLLETAGTVISTTNQALSSATEDQPASNP